MSRQTTIIGPYPTAKYSFDTNVYISIWRYHYPPDMFSPIYDKIEGLIRNGVIKSSYPVKEELERQRDEVSEYFTSFETLFVETTPEEQDYVTQLVNNIDNFPKWGHGDSRKHYTDPYVVALAKAYDLKVVTVSEITIAEIRKTPDDELKKKMITKIGNFSILETSNEIEDLANQIVQKGAIKKSYFEDAYHIALAIINDIDFLLSWNFRHIVRKKTRDIVQMICTLNNLGHIEIITPAELL